MTNTLLSSHQEHVSEWEVRAEILRNAKDRRVRKRSIATQSSERGEGCIVVRRVAGVNKNEGDLNPW